MGHSQGLDIQEVDVLEDMEGQREEITEMKEVDEDLEIRIGETATADVADGKCKT